MKPTYLIIYIQKIKYTPSLIAVKDYFWMDRHRYLPAKNSFDYGRFICGHSHILKVRTFLQAFPATFRSSNSHK